MLHAHDDRVWKPVSPGVDFCFLRRHGADGITVLARMQAGAHSLRHEHPGGEETYMLVGKLRVGNRCLQPGDYLWTPPGIVHGGVAEEYCEFLLVLPGGIKAVPDAAT